jgi:Ala-tRNA(Pro) deacylase
VADRPVFERIVVLLEAHGCPFELIEHAAAATAEEAAAARGTGLDQGTKAIVFKYGTEFGVFAMSAERAVHSAKIRRSLGVQRTRFATRRELREMTGLPPGAVPPFGDPVLPFPLFADPSVLDREEMCFTAGRRTASIRLSTSDYRRVARPQVFSFVRDGSAL